MDDLTETLQQIYVLLEEGNRQALRPSGLTSTQLSLLGHVARGPGVGLTVSEIAAAQLCTRGNAARLVRRLNEAGLVATHGDESDQRLVRVTITPEGGRRLACANDALREADRRRLTRLAPPQRTALLANLTALSRALAADLERDPT